MGTTSQHNSKKPAKRGEHPDAAAGLSLGGRDRVKRRGVEVRKPILFHELFVKE